MHGRRRTAEDGGIELKPLIGRGSPYNGQRQEARRPGDWLDHSPLFSLLLLHRRPWRMARAVRDGAPAAAGVLLPAANTLNVDAGSMVVVYDLGEASANLLQPFWMLPTLAILGLKARDIMGYTFTMFLACFPVALIAVRLLAPHVTS